MDGGGRFAGSLSERAPPRPGNAAATAAALRWRRAERHGGYGVVLEPTGRWRRFARFLDRVAGRVSRLPRHAGFVATVLIIAASAGYGGVGGGRDPQGIDLFFAIPSSPAHVSCG